MWTYNAEALYVVMCVLCERITRNAEALYVMCLLCGCITRNLINHCIRFACNSADTEELPDDDTHVSKHVGAAE
jgi:hypothetical protein